MAVIEYMTLKERPILFNTEMIQAVLEGRKTETRRIFKKQPIGLFQRFVNTLGYPASLGWLWAGFGYKKDPTFYKCPYGQVGDRLWVRETWWRKGKWQLDIYKEEYEFVGTKGVAGYCATDPEPDKKYSYKYPSIFMFRWASRITLEITEIKVERVQDITDGGVAKEGVDWSSTEIGNKHGSPAKDTFANLWDSINKKRGFPWESNPWVWVIKFKVVE